MLVMDDDSARMYVFRGQLHVGGSLFITILV